jgi:hypothetical protein
MTSEELDNRFATVREATRDQHSQASNALNEGSDAALLRQLVSLTMTTNMTLLAMYSELVHARHSTPTTAARPRKAKKSIKRPTVSLKKTQRDKRH